MTELVTKLRQLGDVAWESADALELLTAERDALQSEIDACSDALPGVRYMDPQDGGSVKVSEQVRRMNADVVALEKERDALAATVYFLTSAHPQHDHVVSILAARDARVRAQALRDANDKLMECARGYSPSDWANRDGALRCAAIVLRMADEAEKEAAK